MDDDDDEIVIGESAVFLKPRLCSRLCSRGRESVCKYTMLKLFLSERER